MIKSFDEVIDRVKSFDARKICGVCMADDAAISGALEAEKIGLCTPVFIGNIKEIKDVLDKYGADSNYRIIEVQTPEEGARCAVNLVRNSEIDFILKGHLDTAVLMRAVVDKENGLRTDSLISHVAFEEIPTYHKLIAITDGGMCTYPDVDDKQKIVENAVSVFHKLGYENPKVACITAIEKVNPKMPETVDAGELKKRNQEGIIKCCTVEGPISFDLAYDKEAAVIKGYKSEVSGDADILLAPNIHTGNLVSKALNLGAKAKFAGFVVGARCAIILTSRSATAEEKYLSIAMAALAHQ